MNVTGANNPIYISAKNKSITTGKVDIFHSCTSTRLNVDVDDEFIKNASKSVSEIVQKADNSNCIVQLNKRVNLPAYSGILETDRAIATAIQNCTNDEQTFVYDTIKQNFMINNASNLTEDERLANISLGMKKAEYATQTFIPDSEKDSFMKAMENVAKIATAGIREKDGSMEYGVKKPDYYGYGSGLGEGTNVLDVMKTMDSNSYSEYQRIKKESSNEDRALNLTKYIANWANNVPKKDPTIYDRYEKKTSDYMEKVVSNKKLDTTFKDIDVSSKASFIESLKQFQQHQPNFLTDIINKQLTVLSKH